MTDAIGSVAERWRDERRDMERRVSDGRRRRLRQKLENTNEELEREREARRALADVLENIDHRRRSRGFLRIVMIGGAAYLLGSRAGRAHYETVMAKAGDARRALMERMEGMRTRAVDAAQRVPGTVSDMAQRVPAAVSEATQSLRNGDQGSDDEIAGTSAASVGKAPSTTSATGARTTPSTAPKKGV